MRKVLRKLRMASCLHLCTARQTSEEYPPQTPGRKGRVSVLEESAKLLDSVFAATDFEDTDDAQKTFTNIRSELPKTAMSADGAKLVQKFASLGSAATAESTYMDMIKIIWRTVRLTPGTSFVRLQLFFLAIGAMTVSVRKSPNVSDDVLESWLQKVEVWLGRQLTSGGKGCVDGGEGSVNDRIDRFFSTPYLHDFD
ncbi:uncharacterized protein LOC118419937 isoform X1 [Branchiostoma floridae]|uniref:Uncharacterized protein LOC118419937 isoform X1 n=1 Tax=Branchiostoma floridae TaxID=7739 RepID=A0A9J7LI34_BRAFL|nr:uncharacterized protein LOC118419937 isoform X1 [Branchiostoma floridae]